MDKICEDIQLLMSIKGWIQIQIRWFQKLGLDP